MILNSEREFRFKMPDKGIAKHTGQTAAGTTFVFTDYLGKVSDEWKSSVGVCERC